ncbi:P1 family peptidase [Luteipulveratus flavus]|uniref:P1 family peptidase n=1 Tax=Luteipulveratus flavus TaxID=3031728 RepID=A0ABT6C3C1_9MICO|nr:P1 family peptidase [Luteipulveratus sp. YIM 133296]MDF8262802.1 P1 family peptidase [Luteipulveratus sp. YIM 133296]
MDVPGIRVGHAQRIGDGWLTGTTCVLAPDEGAVAGVDVRGGGPGTRETDLLDPRNLVECIHAVVLTGGSAYGLSAATGVMEALGRNGIGLSMGEEGEVVPLVPAAVIFDLKRGGDFTKRPDAAMGEAAYDAAVAHVHGEPVREGNVGAGTGAKAGGLKGGVGSASAVLPDGTTVAALVVANPIGSCVDLQTGELYAARFGLPGELDHLRRPRADQVATAVRLAEERARDTGLRYGMATTIGVIATDATLTKSQCQKVAAIGHDGMARAIRPVHTMFDGDTLFTLAIGERDAPDPLAFHALLEAAGDCVTRAIGHAVLAAETVEAAGIRWRSYRDAFPSAFA